MHSLAAHLSTMDSDVPHTIWDPSQTVLSLNGFPIWIRELSESASSGVAKLEHDLIQICGIDLAPLLAHIDARLEGRPNSLPFADKPRNAAPAFSFLSLLQDDAYWTDAKKAVLSRVSSDFFQYFNGRAFPKRGRFHRQGLVESVVDLKLALIAHFLIQVDDTVGLAFFLNFLTCGGGPNQTENQDLRLFNSASKRRQIVFTGEWLGILSTPHSGKTTIYTPPLILTRLLLVLWGLVYPIASYLALHVNGETAARFYYSHAYVQRGKPMDEPALTAVLKKHTLYWFGKEMGIRDLRALLSTMIRDKTGLSYTDTDSTNRYTDQAIDRQLGHSTHIANAHYGVHGSASEKMSLTEVSWDHNVSFAWHRFLGFLPGKQMAFDGQKVCMMSIPSCGDHLMLHQVDQDILVLYDMLMKDAHQELSDAMTRLNTPIMELILSVLQE